MTKAQEAQKERDYKKRIIERVDKIENVWILNQVLQFIQNMTRED